MLRNGFFIKISILILTIILFITMISNFIVFYQRYSDSQNLALILFVGILGTLLGLIVRIGLTLMFWYIYEIKYPDEKYNQRIGKKIVASFLFLSITSAVFWSAGMPLIFIICTLVMIIREQKRCYVA
ncbi:hypothetical protein KQI88_10450 [Alkaliphilus sp. MSJ-5]|uniref:Uncharacterized protein n=1 Tax=Alkaliphilus flagellatus TaxID=2841507 RepID=A0ABS6G2X5_9FIRM|nr:hypothetical protein [Alkaliphilus flagellatus]MBU5676838.1 hypothetical protein [Alkaliphilus flagellatus]